MVAGEFMDTGGRVVTTKAEIKQLDAGGEGQPKRLNKNERVMGF